MKKILFILTMQILTNASTVGQEKKSGNVKEELVQCIEEMGKDTFSLLNDCESKYMNYNFQEKKGLFDFKGKKIAFFKGSSGTVKWTKKEYFIVRKETINHMGYVPIAEQLIIFTEDEIERTGYDAAIISSSKRRLTNKEVVKRLEFRSKKKKGMVNSLIYFFSNLSYFFKS